MIVFSCLFKVIYLYVGPGRSQTSGHIGTSSEFPLKPWLSETGVLGFIQGVASRATAVDIPLIKSKSCFIVKITIIS